VGTHLYLAGWELTQSKMNEHKEYTILVKLNAKHRNRAKTQARVLGIRLSELYRQALTSGLNEIQDEDALERIKNIPA